MTRAGFAALIAGAAGLLGACAVGPREYDYSVDIRNTTDRPVSVELLRVEGRNAGKVRADLAPGGTYSSSFTSYDAEYLEARLRDLDAPPDAPYFIHELPEGRSRRDIVEKDGKLVLVSRASAPER